MSKRGRVLGFGGAGLLVVAGIVIALIGGATAQVAAIVLVGAGLVGAVSLVFFEVGRSEDLDRARAERRVPPPPTRSRSSRTGLAARAKPRLERSRGERRRLRRD